MTSTNQLALLGESLLTAQKIELSLFNRVSFLTKHHSSEQEKQVLEVTTPENFLKGSTSDLELTLSVYQQVFGEQLPLNKDELSDFVYHRNLIASNYWRVTGADVKGGEKLSNPEAFLQSFLEKCQKWQAALEAA